jgi:hypothetical protein
MQSAAMIVVKKGCGVWLNNDVVLRLQVDDIHIPLRKGATTIDPSLPNPIKELRRLVERAARQRRSNCV